MDMTKLIRTSTSALCPSKKQSGVANSHLDYKCNAPESGSIDRLWALRMLLFINCLLGNEFGEPFFFDVA